MVHFVDSYDITATIILIYYNYTYTKRPGSVLQNHLSDKIIIRFK